MTLPSFGTTSPIPLSLSPTHRLLWSERGRKFLEEIISSWPQYRDRVNFFENKGISSTSQNLRSEQHLCYGEGIKDRWRIQLQTGPFGTIWWNSWETIRPHYHNAVYILASDMGFQQTIKYLTSDSSRVMPGAAECCSALTNSLKYSGKKKYVNPLEIPGFLHKLVIKFDLIFI